MARLPEYTGFLGRVWHYTFLAICVTVFVFLVVPVLVIVPLSFNADTYFTFSDAMLRLDPDAFSLRWYREILHPPYQREAGGSEWLVAARNSLIVAIGATALATTLGTLAAIGLTRPHMPLRGPILALLISPLIVPIVITGAGMFFFFTSVGLAQSHLGLILAHAALGTPFVVITVTATLSGFDETLTRASASLGARPVTTFFAVVLPLIWPGIISGAVFAFVTSFDEVVVVLYIGGADQLTIPRVIWGGIRQEISLTILAVATILVAISVLLMVTVELLRRRSERLRGVSPT